MRPRTIRTLAAGGPPPDTRKCTNCDGTGDCPSCFGKGRIGKREPGGGLRSFSAEDEPKAPPPGETEACKVCAESGKCVECEGTGRIAVDDADAVAALSPAAKFQARKAGVSLVSFARALSHNVTTKWGTRR